MEAGGDTAAPAPGDADDLEDTRLLSEEAGDGGGVQEEPTDSEDRSLEETGMSFPHYELERTYRGVIVEGGQ